MPSDARGYPAPRAQHAGCLSKSEPSPYLPVAEREPLQQRCVARCSLHDHLHGGFAIGPGIS
jgi:hypothetical protein